MSSSPTLACSRWCSSSRASGARLFSPAWPAARNWSRHWEARAAVIPNSRDTDSRFSPRSRRSTVFTPGRPPLPVTLGDRSSRPPGALRRRRTIDGVWDVPMVDRQQNRRLSRTTNFSVSVPAYMYQKRLQSVPWSSRKIFSAKSPPTGGKEVFCRDLRLSSHKGAFLLFAGRRLRSSSGDMHPTQRRLLILSINLSGNANERRS